jgi:hypothetical protein
MRDLSLAKVVPDFSARGPIHPVDFHCCGPVELTEPTAQLLASSLRRVGEEVIVVRKDGPRSKVPVVVFCGLQEEIADRRQLLRGVEVAGFEIRARGNEVGAGREDPMRRGVRPRGALFGTAAP